MGKKGETRRQQILDTAKSMLLAKGAEGLGMRDVAEKLGITHGNLQYYFRTRHDLMVAIFDQEVAKYTESTQQAVAATSTKRGRLSAILDAGFNVLRSPETALWRIVMSMADHDPEMAAILKKENDLYETVLTKELKQIAPSLSPQRRLHVAKIIHAMLDGLGIQMVYEDPNGANMRALQSEMKMAIIALVEAD